VAGQPTRPRRIPTRSCVACRTSRSKRELLRVVRTPAGRVAIDDTGRIPGRGAYVCRDETCIEKAIERGALARALDTTIPPALREELMVGANERIQGGVPSGKE
jgi:predicted RNA-binding protein YlxR (DUF448 family)